MNASQIQFVTLCRSCRNSRANSLRDLGGTCSHSATVTGPNGGTVMRNTTVSRY
jgi:hypothetical protein